MLVTRARCHLRAAVSSGETVARVVFVLLIGIFVFQEEVIAFSQTQFFFFFFYFNSWHKRHKINMLWECRGKPGSLSQSLLLLGTRRVVPYWSQPLAPVSRPRAGGQAAAGGLEHWPRLQRLRDQGSLERRQPGGQVSASGYVCQRVLC